MIVGTAGHIDHGKTSLVRRLTGRDTDRLPEEKRRGISIELGYAYLAIDENDSDPEQHIGFIDVPGHERFVHAMVSGATGIDFALLVVAADDGPMPQTREHLEILRLLGISRGAIVVTKIDMVDPSQGDLAIAAIADVVAAQPAERWPLFPVSSVTGEGIDTLRDFLRGEAKTVQTSIDDGMFRLAVDRAFSLPGIGTVVTGTAHAGRVAVGDDVSLYNPERSDPIRARVRSVYAQDHPAEVGVRGQRLALNLVGVSVEDAARGSWINSTELDNRILRFDVQLSMSALHDRTVGQGLEVHLHHGAADMMARVYPLSVERAAPGTQCFASILLPAPVAACRGDRLVIRDSQAQTTLAGATILDVHPPNRGRRAVGRLSNLQTLSAADDVTSLLELALSGPLLISRIGQGWNRSRHQIDAMVRQGDLVVAAGVIFHPLHWAAFLERLIIAVDETHVREPEMPGMEINRARRVVAPQLELSAFDELIARLVGDKRLERRGAFLARPGHTVELSKAEQNLWNSLAPLLEQSPYNPPRVRDIAKTTNIPETEIRANLRRVARVGEVTLVALDHFFLTARVSEMAQIAKKLHDQHGAVRASDFRDQIGGGRKVAIQILEFFDRVGYTRRVRDDHLIRRDNPFELH